MAALHCFKAEVAQMRCKAAFSKKSKVRGAESGPDVSLAHLFVWSHDWVDSCRGGNTGVQLDGSRIRLHIFKCCWFLKLCITSVTCSFCFFFLGCR